MLGFATRKLFELAGTLLLVSLIVFLVLRVLPGDPAQVILGINASPESLATLRKELGLEDPLPLQYGNWLKGLLTGDLGKSIFYREEVGRLMVSRLRVTLPLASLAQLLAIAVALPLGLIAATNHRRPKDFGVMALSQLGISVPAFWLGMLALLFFSVQLRLLPSGGFTGWVISPAGALKSLVLPVLTLAVVQSATITRMTRSATLEVLSQDFVSTARSKGLTERRVLYRHVISNSLISILTLVGLQFGQLLAGTVVIETVFNLPGLGRLLLLAVQQRDLQLVQGIVMLLVGGVVVINFLVDLTYGVLDPRIRLT